MIFTLILVFIFIILVILTALYIQITLKRRKTGIIGDILYKDTPKEPGVTLYSKTLPLVGKPDFIIKRKDMVIPLEKKTGKTPSSPYKSHIMQLIAYCLLVEENYNIRPTHGVILYEHKYFEINYSDFYKSELARLVYEILDYKQDKKYFKFEEMKEELCKNCKIELN